MRITDMMRLNSALEAESNVSQQMNQLTQVASSGLRVSAPSDDPAAFASIQERSAQIGIVQARSSAATQDAGNLSLAESTLSSASDILVQIRAIAVQSANGSEDASSRADSATQVQSLQQQLLALANTKGASGYLFSGTKINTPPFDSSGNFQGNAGVTNIEIADGVTAVSNASGADAFTAAGGQDVFATVQSLVTALSSNDVTGIQGSLASLDSARSRWIQPASTRGSAPIASPRRVRSCPTR